MVGITSMGSGVSLMGFLWTTSAINIPGVVDNSRYVEVGYVEPGYIEGE